MPTPFVKLSELPLEVWHDIQHRLSGQMDCTNAEEIFVSGYDEEAEREQRSRQICFSFLQNKIFLAYGMAPHPRIPSSYFEEPPKPVEPEPEERMSNWSRWDEI